jgi:segregation and condensation protein B
MTDENREQMTEDGGQNEGDRDQKTVDLDEPSSEALPETSEPAAQGVSETEIVEEPASEAIESADMGQETAPADDQSSSCQPCEGRNPEDPQAAQAPDLHEGDTSETNLDLTTTPTQENQTSNDESPLTQSERDIDRVVGILLGEPQEAEQEEDRGQKTEDSAVLRDPSSEAGPPSSEIVPTVESVLEAILFATDEPLTDSKLAGIVETTTKQVRESIDSLNAKYAAENHAFRVEQIAGGYQMLTLNTYNSWLKKMLRARSDNKLSPAAMETLAIIAYKQPIIRADVEAIRGVAVGEVVRSLMYKGLVKIAGRAEILGRPMLYGTTKKFLEIFGLNSLKDLPKAEELKNPDRG